MKKLLILLPLLFLIITPQILYADNSSSSATTNQQPVSIDYTLAYPGLLPDNPLYFLKVIRDKVVEFFITDPLQKSAFDLLQADKRLNAGVYLSEEPKVNEELMVSTISKGENYFSESIDQIDLAKQQKEVVNGQIDTVKNAGLKHLEVLQQLEEQVSPQARIALQREASRVNDFEKRVMQLAKE